MGFSLIQRAMNRNLTRMPSAMRHLLAIPGMQLLLALLAAVWCAFALSAALAPDDALQDRVEYQHAMQEEMTRLRNALTQLHTLCVGSVIRQTVLSTSQLLGQLHSEQAEYAALHVKWAAEANKHTGPEWIFGAPQNIEAIHRDTNAWFSLALTGLIPSLSRSDPVERAIYTKALHSAFARLQSQLAVSARALERQQARDEQEYQTATARALAALALGSLAIASVLFISLRRAALGRHTTARHPPAPAINTHIHLGLALKMTQGGTWRRDLRSRPQALHLSSAAHAIMGLDASPSSPEQAAYKWQASISAAGETESGQTLAAALKAIDAGDSVGYDITYAVRRLCDDQIVWLRDVTKVIHDPRGKPLDLLGVTTDVTQAVNAQRQRTTAHDSTRSIDALKTGLVAHLGHEVRTPLNAIIGLSHLALQRTTDAYQHAQLTRIQGAGHQLLQTIDDVLDWSQINAGLLVLERREFALADVLNDLVALFSAKAHAKGLELLIQVDPSLPTHFLGDALRLGQILRKYVGNGIRHTSTGSVRISVYAEQRHASAMLLHFDVRDTGCGLPSAQCASAFLHTDAQPHGGIGLAVCAGLARLMGGAVGVRSEPGQGAHFWLTAGFDLGAEATPPDWPPPDLRGRRVLVADDHAHAQLVLVDMLQTLQMVVDAVENGHAALAAIQSMRNLGHAYDLIFLDWQMPDMDGLAVAHKIAGMALNPAPQLIMVSGYPRQEIQKAALAAGIHDILSKPVTPTVLLDAVYRNLRGKHPVQVVERSTHDLAPLAGLWRSRLGPIQGARILLVEDNEINQEVAFDFLSGAGFIVGIAAHGASALQRILEKEQHWDLVLMDLQMQTMDGFMAAQKIRERFSADALPIIALTGSTQQSDRERCQAAGMQDFLTKPIVPEALWQTLLRWIPPPTATASDSDPANAPANAPLSPFN